MSARIREERCSAGEEEGRVGGRKEDKWEREDSGRVEINEVSAEEGSTSGRVNSRRRGEG